MAPHDAGREGAALLERLAETGAPVTMPVPPMGVDRPVAQRTDQPGNEVDHAPSGR
jgi:hypothetical protein